MHPGTVAIHVHRDPPYTTNFFRDAVEDNDIQERTRPVAFGILVCSPICVSYPCTEVPPYLRSHLAPDSMLIFAHAKTHAG